MKKVLSVLVFLSALLLSGTDAHAFSCGDRLVHAGDSLADVISKCGQPAVKQNRQETVTERTDAATKREMVILVDDWTYNLGPDSFMRYLRFENGKLVEITAGDYGY